jgi:aldehyde dehydrogenase (NAD+)
LCRNGKVICSVQEATEKDVDIAVEAARKVYDDYTGPWRSMTPQARGQLLQKLGELMYREIETLAAVEALDNGKAFNIAKGDVAMSADCLKYYGGWSDKISGKVIETDDFSFRYTRHESIGVCGQIIPWNFPLLMWAWKIGPAIATGNVVVLKTAEQTPLSALVASKLIVEAGFPPGVINIISGFGKTAGAAIASHMGVDKVAFTGSTVTGRSIMKAAASSNLKKVTLELGGKSPTIVFNDADLDAAVDWANFGIYFNHGKTPSFDPFANELGQCCCAGSRIYVQEDIYDKFVEKFTARAKKNVVGDPFEAKTVQGPQVSELQFTRIMDYIKAGKDEGAKVELGGERHGKEGYFIQPTIFTGVNEKMKIMQEEIFGPVVAIGKFKDVDDVLAKAHETFYGLAASVHTMNLNTAIEVSNRLQAGSVWVNCHNFLSHQMPFGGFKQSGIGRELGYFIHSLHRLMCSKYALQNYTNVKSVHVNLTMKAPF